MNNFTHVDRAGWDVWTHNTKPMWITFYPAVPCVHEDMYHAYKAIERVKPGREVWTANNRAIGVRGEGYPTLEAVQVEPVATKIGYEQCRHKYMYFGDQIKRRCFSCGQPEYTPQQAAAPEIDESAHITDLAHVALETANKAITERDRLEDVNAILVTALQQIAKTESTSLVLEYVQGIARAALAKAKS